MAISPHAHEHYWSVSPRVVTIWWCTIERECVVCAGVREFNHEPCTWWFCIMCVRVCVCASHSCRLLNKLSSVSNANSVSLTRFQFIKLIASPWQWAFRWASHDHHCLYIFHIKFKSHTHSCIVDLYIAFLHCVHNICPQQCYPGRQNQSMQMLRSCLRLDEREGRSSPRWQLVGFTHQCQPGE